MNTHKYVEDFKINDKFVEEAIKYFLFGETKDYEIINIIRSLVFCGKNMTEEAVFLSVWSTIIGKFLPET
jgi:hypothetical protein